ncbi:helix-turn-helix domain-containing protein [Cellulophaga baltica]|uniref:two-component regulator propeller domain-containing protein n=1 Tax=Cellulophaga TaxID=104264 RepID=UPI001C070BE3|nr:MULTISPECIES: two-component regulator propeller domain-containing protein [Cellulophaga]MBU2997322.1 helix-turn-helix domain-containing protein [Cellulophaga baltica]MDO6768720.1 two-component regulator propeller domain-containing protein [Cellulophaga sp. 1_MG-2023]
MKRLVVLLFCLPIYFVQAQQIKFQSFTTEVGLSNNSVADIENDKNGGLWIATWDGLNYFNGHSFETFKHNPNDSESIPSNYLLKIEKDKNDVIWVFSSEGTVSKYLGNKRFKNYKFDRVPNDIKLATDGSILVQLDNTYYEYNNSTFQLAEKLPVNNNEEKELKKILLSKYSNLTINDVYKDNLGNIWFATRSNGLYIIPNHTGNLHNNQIEHYTYDLYNSYSFNSNEIEKIHEDIFGNIWLAQKDGGLSMAYSGSENITSITPHPIKFPHLPNETIRAITKDENGIIWIGYYNDGLYYFDTESQCYKKYFLDISKKNQNWERIRSLFTASDGSVWAGTYAGLIRIKNNNYISYKASEIENFPNNRNYSIYEDEDEQLWITCWGGLAKFNLKTNNFEYFEGQEHFQNLNIRSIKKSKNEIIVGTEANGVFIYNLKTKIIEQITRENGLLGNSIYAVFKEEIDATYWIASLGGVSVLNNEKKVIKNITEDDGLPSHMVYGILKNKDQFWLSTTKGVAVISKNTFNVIEYNPSEGWQASEFSEGAYYQDKKGLLFFGGVNGLNYFNPSSLKPKNIKTSFKIIVDDNENFSSNLKKKYSNNVVEIEIHPIKFPKNATNKVFYTLEGKDTSWKTLNKPKKISYQNLKPGDYTFYVKNENETKVKVLTLKILKPFYSTTFFYIFFVFIVLIGVLIFILIKNRTAKKKQIKLENQIALRTKVIENQKEDLLQINKELDKKNKQVVLQKEKLLNLHNNLKNEDFEIDKFKTFVLSEFQEPISKIVKNINALPDDNDVKEGLINYSGKLVKLISEWNYLDHVKDIGPIKKTATNLPKLLKNSFKKISKNIQGNKINLNTKLIKIDDWVSIDVLRLRLLLQYLFCDIIKYSDERSSLSIEITVNDNVINLCLESNSSILKNNWQNMLHYSPYFKAVQVLLSDLNGAFIKKPKEDFIIALQIPFDAIENDFEQLDIISWKHFDKQENLVKGNQNLLIFTEEENYSSANQILEDKGYNLIFESEVNDLTSAVNQIPIHLVLFYQASFSKELIYFFNTIKNNEAFKFKKTPMVYITEDITHGLQEELVEFGIDVLIQMPASESFILKKISSLIQKRDQLNENNLHNEIFQILTDTNEISTPNDKLLKASLEIIKKELSNASFNVEMLVEELGVSRVKCYRLFKELLSKSPSDVITSLRLQKAATLLKTKKLNISEISFECGYNDPKYFGRSFKKYFGASPKEYKEQIK